MWTPFPTGNTCEDVLLDDKPIDAFHSIRLCNFVKGSDQILDSHRKWLETYVKWGMAAEHSWFDLVGYASELPYIPDDKTGGNWALSNRRCAAVRHVMERIMIDQSSNRGITFHVVMGVGDSRSDPDPTPDHNHGFFRAVVVKLFDPDQGVKISKQELRHGYTTIDATHFEFEPVEIAGAGISRVGTDWLYFGIHDLDNHRRRYFAHIGGSGSPDLPFMPAISFSAQHSGPPVPFTSPWGIVELEDFEGLSYLIQAVGATVGTHNIWGDMRLKWHPKAWTERNDHSLLDIHFSLSSGFGISAGSAGAGRVIIMGPHFKPTFYSR